MGFSFCTPEKLLPLSRSLPPYPRPPPCANVSSSIVAVHGLCGDLFGTWTEETSGKLSLQDFLPS